MNTRRLAFSYVYTCVEETLKKNFLSKLMDWFENDLAESVLGWHATKIVQIIYISVGTWPSEIYILVDIDQI